MEIGKNYNLINNIEIEKSFNETLEKLNFMLNSETKRIKGESTNEIQ